MGGGGAFLDMDGDGDLDVYLVQGGNLAPGSGPPEGHRLFNNRGDGTFEEVPAGSGEPGGYGMGVAAGDYDNDGAVDLYVTRVGPNLLLRNDGWGRFTDVTDAAGVGGSGVWSTSAAFLDYDNDGDLDLFVVNYVGWSLPTELNCYNPQGPADYCSPNSYRAPLEDTLYRNNGDGTFSDVTREAGIALAFGNGLGVVCGDFDGDGLTDVFVANDQTPNRLWRNEGDGRFVDVALAAGSAVDEGGRPRAGMGVTAADFDFDGRLDVLVCNLVREPDSLLRNEGSYFSDASGRAGLSVVPRRFTRFGVAWCDFDNDGFLDLYEAAGRVARQGSLHGDDPYAEPNLLFRGLDGGVFREVGGPGGVSGLPAKTSRAAVFGDIDNDGGVDVLVINRDAPADLLRNIVRHRGNWILLRVLDPNGRDAYGASVTATVGGRRVRRDVRAAYSYLASNDPRVHFGLGDAAVARDVSVRWVDGTVESFGDLPANRIHLLAQGRGSGRVAHASRPEPLDGTRPTGK